MGCFLLATNVLFLTTFEGLQNSLFLYEIISILEPINALFSELI